MKSSRKLRITVYSLLISAILTACGQDAFERLPHEWNSHDATVDSVDRIAAETPVNIVPSSNATAGHKRIPAPANPLRGQNRRIRINNIGHLREIFNDSNYVHYAYAERLGIKPIGSLADAFYTRRPIVAVTSNDSYYIDTLTHSLPFLVPEAERLLRDIGDNFIDSLHARGATGHRIRVTSLLRTPHTVRRLRRINRNATDSSTHQFATTFDISYSRFHTLDTLNTINQEDLKNLLAEVLADLRAQGRCLVKFERRSPCFHITAIK